jgi:hypothetical protein
LVTGTKYVVAGKEGSDDAASQDTTPCDEYQRYFDAEFDSGEDDPYPELAKDCCDDFLELYDSSDTVRDVAACLVQAEGSCQNHGREYARDLCRRLMHIECYKRHEFIPVLGIPGVFPYPEGACQRALDEVGGLF